MSTQLWFAIGTSESNQGIHRGTNTANLRGTTTGWNPWGMSTALPTGSAGTNYSVTSVTGATAGVESESSLPQEFYSPPIDADTTISGTITFNLWGAESSMSANAAINCVIERVGPDGTIISTIIKTTRTTELGTSTAAANFTGTPTSTDLVKGDRLRFRIFFDDAGTMASGFTLTTSLGSVVAADPGDSWVTFTETFGFLTTDPSGTTLYLTNTAGPAVGSANEKEMWTSRGGSAVTGVTNTASGWTSGIQWTDTAGGTALEWYTKPLTAFTLDGLVKVNLRVHTSSTSSRAAPRVELAVVNEDGSGAVVWSSWVVMDQSAIGGPVSASGGYGSMSTTEAARRTWLVGNPTTLTDGQRLRLRVHVDDTADFVLVTGHTATLTYNGPTGGASGDSFITLPQTVTEFTADPNADAGSASATGTANNASVTVSPNAGSATAATGTAQDIDAKVSPTAPVATATGAGQNAVTSVVVRAFSSSEGSLPTLYPVGDGDGTTHQPRGWATQSYLNIDETGAADGNTILAAFSTNANETSFLLQDMPSDFSSMVSLTINVRARASGRVDDIYFLLARVVKADGTALATGSTISRMSVFGHPMSTSDTTANITFTTVDTAATKADWDGAIIQLYQGYAATGGADAFAAIVVEFVNFTGTYATLVNAAGVGTAHNASVKVSPNAGSATGTGTATSPPPSYGVNSVGTLTLSSLGDYTLGWQVATSGTVELSGVRLYSPVSRSVDWQVWNDSTQALLRSGTADVVADTWTSVMFETALTFSPGTDLVVSTSVPTGNDHYRNNAADGTFNSPFSYVAGRYTNALGTYPSNSWSPWFVTIDVMVGSLPISEVVAPTAIEATATGTAHDATVSTTSSDVSVNAIVATGTGTSQQPNVSVAPTALSASGTGTSQQPGASVKPTALVASGTGVALQPSVDVKASALTATATGAAQTPSAALLVNAGSASGTGTAHNATISTASNVNAAATLAEATGTANQPSVSVFASALVATATGTAQAPGISTTDQAPAAVATATGTAQQPSTSVAANALVASASGTAYTAGVSTTDQAPADVATATGTAHDATVSTGSNASAAAGEATATGTAHTASISTNDPVEATVATATGTAYNASVTVAGNAGTGTGTGTGNNVVGKVDASPLTATATGAAQQPSISLLIRPTVAIGTGAGQNATATVRRDALAQVATGSGSALSLSALIAPTALTATATGVGRDASIPAQFDVEVTWGQLQRTSRGSRMYTTPAGSSPGLSRSARTLRMSEEN